MFFHYFKTKNQNFINFEVCDDLNPLFNKNQRWFPRFGDCSPHHEWKRLLSSVGCSHGLINNCWIHGIHSFNLIVNINFNCEEFFIKKNNFLLCRASLQNSEKNLCTINFFLTCVRCYLFLILQRISLRLFLIILLIEITSHSRFFICLADCFGFLFTLSWTASVNFFDRVVRGFPLLWHFSDVQSCLNL